MISPSINTVPTFLFNVDDNLGEHAEIKVEFVSTLLWGKGGGVQAKLFELYYM